MRQRRYQSENIFSHLEICSYLRFQMTVPRSVINASGSIVGIAGIIPVSL